MKKALDFANYTPVPTGDQVRCWLSEGYTTAIVGVSFGNVARQQLEICSRNGMDVEAFAWVRFSEGWQQPLDKALDAIRGLPVRRLWLDCEDATNWTEVMIERRVLDAELYVRPHVHAKAIYTGGWWWNVHMPHSRRFVDWDLWLANYVSNPNVPPTGNPPLFGGWQKAAMWQYAGTIPTCGLNTDRNVVLEDHMASIEYEELRQRDEDIKTVLAQVNSGVNFLIKVVNRLAPEVLGDNDPDTLDLQQRVKALEADK